MIDRKEGMKRYIAVLEEETEKCRSIKMMNMLLRELGQMTDQLQRPKK